MINAYINLDKKHANFLQLFKDAGIKKIALKNIQNQSQLDIALTSLSKYGETKKSSLGFGISIKTCPRTYRM